MHQYIKMDFLTWAAGLILRRSTTISQHAENQKKEQMKQHLQVHDIVQHCKGFFFLTFDADEMIVDLRQPLYKMQQIYKQGLAVLAKTR
jgi:D-alanyl-lipoteichoic acid acyltransferase DltB (MBOAT superfamily)